jgi:hypothetical protein
VMRLRGERGFRWILMIKAQENFEGARNSVGGRAIETRVEYSSNNRILTLKSEPRGS